MRKVKGLDYHRAILLGGEISRVGGGIRHHGSGNLEHARRCAGGGISDLTTFRIHTLRSTVEMEFTESQDTGK